MMRKKFVFGAFIAIVSLVFLAALGLHWRRDQQVGRARIAMEVAWKRSVADPESSQHFKNYKRHQKELVRLGYLQQRAFEFSIQRGSPEASRLIAALMAESEGRSDVQWSPSGPRIRVAVTASAERMPQWEKLMLPWNPKEVAVPKSPRRSIVKSVGQSLGFGGTLAFSEENLFGLEHANEDSTEFIAKVTRVSDYTKTLANDPRAIPYIVHFKIVEGEMPLHPDYKKLSLSLQHEPGIDSIGRFKESQEVVFVCSADGAIRGMKNVPSFKELKNRATREAVAKEGQNVSDTNAPPVAVPEK